VSWLVVRHLPRLRLLLPSQPMSRRRSSRLRLPWLYATITTGIAMGAVYMCGITTTTEGLGRVAGNGRLNLRLRNKPTDARLIVCLPCHGQKAPPSHLQGSFVGNPQLRWISRCVSGVCRVNSATPPGCLLRGQTSAHRLGMPAAPRQFCRVRPPLLLPIRREWSSLIVRQLTSRADEFRQAVRLPDDGDLYSWVDVRPEVDVSQRT
jgi:hypothetical protein